MTHDDPNVTSETERQDSMQQNPMDLFFEVRNFRKKAGLTQIDVAKQLGWKDGSRVSRLEKGQIFPSAEVWAQIARILGMTLPEVLPTEGDNVRKGLHHPSFTRKASLSPEGDITSTRTAHGIWRYDQKANTLTCKTHNGISVVVPIDELGKPNLLINWIRHVQSWGSDIEISSFIKVAFSIIP